MINDGIYRLVVDRIDHRVNSAGLDRNLFRQNDYELEYYDTRTDRPPVVIIHGLGVEGKFQWYKQLNLLSPHYRVIMPNLLSFGASHSSVNTYTISEQVRAIQELIDTLKLEKPIVMGISYGGLVTAELARLNGDHLKKVLLMDAPVKFFDISDIERVGDRLKVNSIESLFVPENSVGLRNLFFAATGLQVPMWKGVMDKFYQELFVSSAEEKRLMIKEMLAAINDYRNVDYSQIAIPVKLIWGEKDLLVPVDRAHLLQKHIGSNAELSVISGAGHVPNFQRSARFNKLMMEFLSRNE